MEIAVMVWFICGIACAAIGSSRGDRGVAWFFLESCSVRLAWW